MLHARDHAYYEVFRHAKVVFAPNSFSLRPSPFFINRKTGWDRVRTCNFGQIMSLIRC